MIEGAVQVLAADCSCCVRMVCAQCKHADAMKELDRRQDSYMRREEQLKLQLAAFTQPQEAGDNSSSTSSDGSNSSSSQHGDPGPSDSGQAAAGSRAPKVPKPLTLQEMQEQVGYSGNTTAVAHSRGRPTLSTPCCCCGCMYAVMQCVVCVCACLRNAQPHEHS
jgi:hypothetical protein